MTIGEDVVNTTEEGSNKISVKLRDSRPVSRDSWTKWTKGDRGKSEDNLYGSAGSKEREFEDNNDNLNHVLSEFSDERNRFTSTNSHFSLLAVCVASDETGSHLTILSIHNREGYRSSDRNFKFVFENCMCVLRLAAGCLGGWRCAFYGNFTINMKVTDCLG
ncbi:hypothetical protein Q1695_000432 [Nippostrongylus brasiliensis]|nr:hypothetical protein Q1695_000432 [Nippostrongylus brasiliensis]